MVNQNYEKKDYLVKTLSRTKRKDYENYVVNRLYSQLDDLDIKPMTQKYVKRTLNGTSGYALIDLYFPQFNIGIEVDEAHHISQEELDRLRTEDIVSAIDGYDERRIIVSNRTILEINDDINKETKYIKQKKQNQVANGTFKKWEEIPTEIYFKSKEKITIDDDIEFETINDASNIIFGTEYNGQQQSYFPIPTITNKRVMAWFPKLAVEKDGQLVAVSSGWNNTLNDEKDTIVEYNENGKNADINMDMLERVTFMKIKNSITGHYNYKFLGIFIPKQKINGKATYNRISTEFKLIK